jgi:K+-sensing histidine kinase KdpD
MGILYSKIAVWQASWVKGHGRVASRTIQADYEVDCDIILLVKNMNAKRSAFLTQKAILAACIAGVLLLGFVDYVTGYEFGFFVLYFVPIVVAAWALGARKAYMVSVLCAVVWFVSDWYARQPYSHALYSVWNSAIRLLSFVIISYAVSKIHSLLSEERKISEDLRDALSEVKTLSGLLPICAWCKKIRNDRGYWQQIEKYVEEHSDIQFSHGLCQECASKVLNEEMKEEPIPTETDDALESDKQRHPDTE